MNIQELLRKATPRPWGFGVRDLGSKMVLYNGETDILFVYNSLAKNDPAQINILFTRHAINNFEGLLDAAKAILPFLPGDVVTKTKPEHVQVAQALRQAIRQAEEVEDQ